MASLVPASLFVTPLPNDNLALAYCTYTPSAANVGDEAIDFRDYFDKIVAVVSAYPIGTAEAGKIGGAYAAGTITFSVGLATDTNTIVVGDVTYTLKTTLSVGPAVANEVLLGAAFTDTATNLTSAINATSGAGTTYGTGTVANPLVAASRSSGVVTVTSITPGTQGNSIVLTESATNVAVSGSGTISGASNQAATVWFRENLNGTAAASTAQNGSLGFQASAIIAYRVVVLGKLATV
jgi:hypothetical protein